MKIETTLAQMCKDMTDMSEGISDCNVCPIRCICDEYMENHEPCDTRNLKLKIEVVKHDKV